MNISNLLKLIFVAFALFVFASCSQSPKSDSAETGEAQEVDEEATASATTVELDLEKSLVTWVGTKPVGKHNGTFNLKEGSIALEDGKIVGGKYIIDIKSMKDLDLDDKKMNKKLVGHLLSAEFFEVDEFPEATFEIVEVKKGFEATEEREDLDEEYILADPTHTVTGNLELKGVKKSITFPAKIEVDGEKVSAKAKFNINRKDWGMDYGTDESLGDNFIRPEVHIGFDISTK